MLDLFSQPDFWTYVLIGFVAQIIDGALGMAYGTLCTAVLLASGISPLIVSASVHSAQFFTAGISALSHSYFKNINRRLFLILAIAGSTGGILGALLLTQLDAKFIKPWIACYLMMLGFFILWRHFRGKVKPVYEGTGGGRNKFRALLGFGGGFLDALGGGWGPIVTTNLIARNEDPRYVIGSVNAAEFFVKTLIAFTLAAALAFSFHQIVLGLLIGGVLAAPLGAFVLRFIRPQILIVGVGFLIIGLSTFTLYNTFFK